MSKRIDQLLAGYADGDAISQEARLFRGLLRDAGYESDIFAPAERVGIGVRDDCFDLSEFDSSAQKAVILHYSTSSKANQIFMGSGCRRIIRYHNITPAGYYAGFDDSVEQELKAAHKEFRSVITAADSCWSASAYNAEMIESLGVKESKVLPLMFRMDEFDGEIDSGFQAEFGDGLTNWLFVGRIAPNKCIEELIVAFAWYQTINPASRLIITGSVLGCPRYYAMLRLLASRLDLTNVCFTGFVSNDARFTMYKCADVFVTASRHEGYCLPLIEAMARGVPVVARHTGGMPEAMGCGGVAFDNLNPQELAVLINRVCSDPTLHKEVLDSQQERMQQISTRSLQQELAELL